MNSGSQLHPCYGWRTSCCVYGSWWPHSSISTCKIGSFPLLAYWEYCCNKNQEYRSLQHLNFISFGYIPSRGVGGGGIAGWHSSLFSGFLGTSTLFSTKAPWIDIPLSTVWGIFSSHIVINTIFCYFCLLDKS